VQDLLPLAQNYLKSEVFQRVKQAQKVAPTLAGDSAEEVHRLKSVPLPKSSPGLWSELRFRLRRPLGILTGTIDKLLIQPAPDGDGVDVEIIDFKTNRFRRSPAQAPQSQKAMATATVGKVDDSPGKASLASKPSQGLFDFDSAAEDTIVDGPTFSSSSVEYSVESQIENTARDYQLQMQSYALALRELLPSEVKINSLRATLHFIDPNVESTLPDDILQPEACARAIDDAMGTIVALDGTLNAELFPPTPASHCRMCNFLELCPAGREWLRS
jgi:hypothetical protein